MNNAPVPTRKLLLIDATHLVRRVYEGNPEKIDLVKKAKEGVQNAYASFRRLLDTQRPTHALAVFDHEGRNWRHAIYPEYQANRKPMDEALRNRLPAFYDALSDFGLRMVAIPNVEADDVIETVATRWIGEARGEVVIATHDKDLHTLAALGASIWDHFGNQWHDHEWIEEKFGVPAHLLSDYLALMGDSTDGVPGVEGIGKKKAATLLNTYGDLDAVMACAGTLLNPVGELLRKGRASLALSRQLVALKSDVQVGVSWNDLRYAF